MLSKLWLMVSGGRNEAASTSSDSMSRIEGAYSARFSRWNVGGPGSGARRQLRPAWTRARRERIERRRGRTLLARRRHHARAQLADDRLGDVGALIRLRRVIALEDEIPLRLVGVVAFQAVLLDEGLVGGAMRACDEARRARGRCAMRGNGPMSAAHRPAPRGAPSPPQRQQSRAEKRRISAFRKVPKYTVFGYRPSPDSMAQSWGFAAARNC